MKEPNMKKRQWIAGILLIMCLLLAPGIRGYDNWQVHEIVLFIALPIGVILYQLLKGQQASLK